MEYKHKSGAQKRKEKLSKEKNTRKGQQTLELVGFTKKKDPKHDADNAAEIPCSSKQDDFIVGVEMDIAESASFENLSASLGINPSDAISCEKSLEEVASTFSGESEIEKETNEVVTNKQPYDYDIGDIESLFIPPLQVEDIIRRGPKHFPCAFPDDKTGHRFPTGILEVTLKNGEKIKRNWLVWSMSKKALFCYPCRIFSKFSEAKRSALALPSGYSIDKSWKKLHDRVPEHENSHNHKTCYLEWCLLETRLRNQTTINFCLSENMKSEVARWREILKRLLDVTLFLAERGLAFRGTSNAIGDFNNGNFLGILELIGHYDPILADHLKKVKDSQTSKNRMLVHYLSPSTQNEFIECCASHVVSAIQKEREAAKYYAIIVDATPDSAHVEQTVFIIRYILLDTESNQYKIHERFLEFVDCNKKTGEDIAALIRSTLGKHHIPLSECRAQGYDNGSNMSGKYKGAQSHILQQNPLALFSPCACHTLNLCGVQAAESCAEVISFFGVVQKLYNIFSSSPQRWEILKKNIGSSLHSMSDTRWSARVDSVKPFAAHIPGLIQAIRDLKTLNISAEIKSDLNGIETYINSFECIIMASIWVKALTLINYRNTILQAREATVDVETENIKGLIVELQHLRNSWDGIVSECKAVAKNLDIPQTFPEKRRKIRKRFFDETEDDPATTDQEVQFRQNVFCVLLDCLIGNMTTRFAALKIIEERFSFLWKYLTLDAEDLRLKVEIFCEHYDVDVSHDLYEETLHLKAIHNANLGQDALPPLKLLNRLVELKIEALFPNTAIALRIYCTIPVSVAEGERSFSVLARIKNVLRSTMCQDRLTSLGTLALEPSLARKINFDEVISYFANQKVRKAYLK